MTYLVYDSSYLKNSCLESSELDNKKELEKIVINNNNSNTYHFISSFNLKSLLNSLSESHADYTYEELSCLFLEIVNSLNFSKDKAILMYTNNCYKTFDRCNSKFYTQLKELAKSSLELFYFDSLALSYSQRDSPYCNYSHDKLCKLLQKEHSLSSEQAIRLSHHILFLKDRSLETNYVANISIYQEENALKNLILLSSSL